MSASTQVGDGNSAGKLTWTTWSFPWDFPTFLQFFPHCTFYNDCDACVGEVQSSSVTLCWLTIVKLIKKKSLFSEERVINISELDRRNVFREANKKTNVT